MNAPRAIIPKTAMVDTAVRLLQQLCDEAEKSKMFGIVSVEISYQNGQPRKIRRRVDDTVTS